MLAICILSRIIDLNTRDSADPSAIEKAELVRVTGLSKRQVWYQTSFVPVLFCLKWQLHFAYSADEPTHDPSKACS